MIELRTLQGSRTLTEEMRFISDCGYRRFVSCAQETPDDPEPPRIAFQVEMCGIATAEVSVQRNGQTISGFSLEVGDLIGFQRFDGLELVESEVRRLKIIHSDEANPSAGAWLETEAVSDDEIEQIRRSMAKKLELKSPAHYRALSIATPVEVVYLASIMCPSRHEFAPTRAVPWRD
ncbi:hypothetical protein [Thioalkalivibrio sp. ALE23]|uniref:hypothetical protein n=1 Tax=Thioalkalivibrio sp. ALE23 TaxID=1265495 RepID=UPI0003611419|nr:hypothetical protein [Thioalkalivibrio sp. ALE23]